MQKPQLTSYLIPQVKSDGMYSLHALVEGKFPSQTADKRVIKRFAKQNNAVIIRSEIAPEGGTVETLETVFPELDDTFKFEVSLFPVIRTTYEDGGKKKQARRFVSASDTDGQLEWFKHHSSAWGFVTLDLKVIKAEVLQISKETQKPFSYPMITFSGQGLVHDEEVTFKTIDLGVGFAKAYGAGVFLIKE